MQHFYRDIICKIFTFFHSQNSNEMPVYSLINNGKSEIYLNASFYFNDFLENIMLENMPTKGKPFFFYLLFRLIDFNKFFGKFNELFV